MKPDSVVLKKMHERCDSVIDNLRSLKGETHVASVGFLIQMIKLSTLIRMLPTDPVSAGRAADAARLLSLITAQILGTLTEVIQKESGRPVSDMTAIAIEIAKDADMLEAHFEEAIR